VQFWAGSQGDLANMQAKSVELEFFQIVILGA
jgi:hypothetical protein